MNYDEDYDAAEFFENQQIECDAMDEEDIEERYPYWDASL